MKRRTFTATVYDVATGDGLATTTSYAMNSGIRASEKLVRKIALTDGSAYTGTTPAARVNDEYRRTWTNETTGRIVLVCVKED